MLESFGMAMCAVILLAIIGATVALCTAGIYKLFLWAVQ